MGNDAGFPAAAVSAFDNELWGKLKDIFCTPTSTISAVSAQHTSIYPNPANDKLYINTHASYTAAVYNMTGQCLSTQNVGELSNSLDISSLSPGTYYITLRNEKETQTLRFIKQ